MDEDRATLYLSRRIFARNLHERILEISAIFAPLKFVQVLSYISTTPYPNCVEFFVRKSKEGYIEKYGSFLGTNSGNSNIISSARESEKIKGKMGKDEKTKWLLLSRNEIKFHLEKHSLPLFLSPLVISLD